MELLLARHSCLNQHRLLGLESKARDKACPAMVVVREQRAEVVGSLILLAQARPDLFALPAAGLRHLPECNILLVLGAPEDDLVSVE